MNTCEKKIGTKENSAKEIFGTSNENTELEKSPSTMGINASDDHENKEQNSKKSLKFGGWLPDVMDWIKRTEMAQSSLSISSYTINRDCWPKLHGHKVKPHTIWRLDFYREKDDAGNRKKFLRKDRKILIPIADINPPEYIIGFENIYFHFVDNQVVQFLQSILPLLNEEIEIQCFPLHWYKPKNHPVDDLMALLAPKTEKLKFFYRHDFYVLDQFNQLFPNFISGLRSIYLKLDIHRGWREEDLDLILKWLMSEPREDGKSKMLQIDFYYFECYTYHTIIRRIKKEFSKAKKSSNFVIRLKFFKMEEMYESIESLSDEDKEEKENDEMVDEEEDSEMVDDVKEKGDEVTNEDDDNEKKGKMEEADENDEIEDEEEDDKMGDIGRNDDEDEEKKAEREMEDEENDDEVENEEDEGMNEDEEKKDEQEEEDEQVDEMEDEEKDDEVENEEDEGMNEDEEKKDEQEEEDEQVDEMEDEEKDDEVENEEDEGMNEDEEKKDEQEEEDEQVDEMEDEVKSYEDEEEEKDEPGDAKKLKNEDEDYFKMLDFKIENEVTGEILELKYKSYGDYFLVRHNKGNETEVAELVNWKKNEFERKSTTTIWMVSF